MILIMIMIMMIMLIVMVMVIAKTWSSSHQSLFIIIISLIDSLSPKIYRQQQTNKLFIGLPPTAMAVAEPELFKLHINEIM